MSHKGRLALSLSLDGALRWLAACVKVIEGFQHFTGLSILVNYFRSIQMQRRGFLVFGQRVPAGSFRVSVLSTGRFRKR